MHRKYKQVMQEQVYVSQPLVQSVQSLTQELFMRQTVLHVRMVRSLWVVYPQFVLFVKQDIMHRKHKEVMLVQVYVNSVVLDSTRLLDLHNAYQQLVLLVQPHQLGQQTKAISVFSVQLDSTHLVALHNVRLQNVMLVQPHQLGQYTKAISVLSVQLASTHLVALHNVRLQHALLVVPHRPAQ
jgi:hypothetical protein